MEVKERIKKVSEIPETTEENLRTLQELEIREIKLKKESRDITDKINELRLSTNPIKYRTLIVGHITPKNE